MIEIGDLVEFKNGLYKDEEGIIYKVIEVNGDRVILELVNSKLPLPPQSIANTFDLVKL